MRRLERLLGFSREDLRLIADHAGSYYSPFPKRYKQRPFTKIVNPPKLRIIDNPLDPLKTVQAQINMRLLRPVKLPEYMCGGVKGKQVLDNVRIHQSARILVKIDIVQFFPSITNMHVYSVWTDLLGCSPSISSILTQLTTFKRHLPQGAPTSTTLANLVLYHLDGPIRAECDRLRIRYSSWIDDLPFSSDNPRPMIGVVARVLGKAGFRISRTKLAILGPGERKILNGVLVGRSLSVPPACLARIRSGIHKLRQGNISQGDVGRYVQSLTGSIAQVTNIDPRKGKKLRADLAAVCRAPLQRGRLSQDVLTNPTTSER